MKLEAVVQLAECLRNWHLVGDCKLIQDLDAVEFLMELELRDNHCGFMILLICNVLFSKLSEVVGIYPRCQLHLLDIIKDDVGSDA
jgi:hypothetical protein